jgi:antirestriction protein ArdC
VHALAYVWPVRLLSNQRSEQEAVQGYQYSLPVGRGASKGYERGEWATYQQWQERGVQVRKGEKATLVVFWKFANDAAETDDGEDTPKSGSRLVFTRGYSVFNAAQVDGYTPKTDAETPLPKRIERAEAFFQGIGGTVRHGGNQAFYSPVSDHIQMPPFQAFVDGVSYYSSSRMSTPTGRRL